MCKILPYNEVKSNVNRGPPPLRSNGLPKGVERKYSGDGIRVPDGMVTS